MNFKSSFVASAFLISAFGSGMATAACDVAAFIWPAYQPEPRWAELGIFKDGKGEWQNVYEAEKRFPDDYQGVKPLWGYENEADPVAVARKIDAATAAGVNVFIYDWYWYGGRPFLENALNEGFLKASNCERMKFYIMWANHDVNGLWNNKIGGSKKKQDHLVGQGLGRRLQENRRALDKTLLHASELLQDQGMPRSDDL